MAACDRSIAVAHAVQTGLTVVLLLLTLLSAVDAPPPPSKPSLPAPWACSSTTILQSLPCTFEGTPSTSTTTTTNAAARASAKQLCTAVSAGKARSDAAVYAACAKAADAIVCAADDDRAAVVDDDGRFVSGACYGAVKAVVVEFAAVKAEAVACCGCVGGHDACVKALVDDVRPAGAASPSCASSCAAVLLRVPEKAATPPAPPSKK